MLKPETAKLPPIDNNTIKRLNTLRDKFIKLDDQVKNLSVEQRSAAQYNASAARAKKLEEVYNRQESKEQMHRPPDRTYFLSKYMLYT